MSETVHETAPEEEGNDREASTGAELTPEETERLEELEAEQGDPGGGADADTEESS